MKAAWYEKQGPARDVLIVGEMPDPHPGPGEVRICVTASGINPGDVKKRGDTFGLGMPFPRVIPHSDGAGQIDEIGAGISRDWLGQVSGAMAHNPIAPSEPPPNSQSSARPKLLRSRTAFLPSKVLVSASPA